MSSRTSVALLLASALTASAASAQHPLHVALAAGGAIPTGATARYQSLGYYGSAALAIGAPLSPIGFRLEGIYNQLSGPNFWAGVRTANQGLRTMSANANVVLSVPRKMAARPYAIAGIGYYNTRYLSGYITQYGEVHLEHHSHNTVGYSGGAGLQFALSETSAFIEARLHVVPNASGVSNESVRFVPVTLGIMF